MEFGQVVSELAPVKVSIVNCARFRIGRQIVLTMAILAEIEGSRRQRCKAGSVRRGTCRGSAY